jgi:hypothetical protein
MAEVNGHTELPWKWHPKSADQSHNGSVYSERREGHAYAVAMQPQYVTDEQWKADAQLIVTTVNTYPAVEGLVKALEAIERGGVAVLLDAALSDAPEGFDECPINPNVLQKIVDDSRSALSRFREAQAGGGE